MLGILDKDKPVIEKVTPSKNKLLNDNTLEIKCDKCKTINEY